MHQHVHPGMHDAWPAAQPCGLLAGSAAQICFQAELLYCLSIEMMSDMCSKKHVNVDKFAHQASAALAAAVSPCLGELFPWQA